MSVEIFRSVELFREPPKALNWDKNKQAALIGHLMVDEKFFVQTKGKIDPEWFVEEFATRILKALLDFHTKFSRLPTISEIRDYREFRLEDQVWYSRIKTYISLCVAQREEFGLDNLRAELTDWMKARYYHTAVAQSVPLFNAEKPTEAYFIIEKAAKQIRESSFEKDREVSFENYPHYFDTQRKEYENALTWGLPAFDKLLAPEADRGSLLLGDTTIILAPTNVGKTTCMITVLVQNILAGKPVLFIVHEGREQDIMKKVWCSILNVDENRLMVMYRTPEGRKIMDDMLCIIKRFLTFVPICQPGLTVEEVVAVIERKIEERYAKYRSGYAMLVDDYPAKLMTQQSGKGAWARRQIDDYVYNEFVALALKHHFHALLAIQTNREGSKINRWGKEARLLTMEDVQESWGPMTAATNVITINRDPVAAARNRLTYYICKSRSSQVGWAVVCRTNYANARTHDVNLGCRYYQSASTLADKIDDLLDDASLGTEIPPEKYLK